MGHQVPQDGNWNIQPAQLDWQKGTVLLSQSMDACKNQHQLQAS